MLFIILISWPLNAALGWIGGYKGVYDVLSFGTDHAWAEKGVFSCDGPTVTSENVDGGGDGVLAQVHLLCQPVACAWEQDLWLHGSY